MKFFVVISLRNAFPPGLMPKGTFTRARLQDVLEVHVDALRRLGRR